MLKVEFDIKDVKKLCDKLKKQLKTVKGARAGYIKDKAYPNGFSLIKNALVQEYGNDKIPSRPFLRRSLKDAKKWTQYINEMFEPENELSLEQIAGQIGLMMKKSIQDSIDSDIPPPNSPETIKRKKSSHTLIDTGTLRNSVQSEVIRNNEDARA